MKNGSQRNAPGAINAMALEVRPVSPSVGGASVRGRANRCVSVKTVWFYAELALASVLLLSCSNRFHARLRLAGLRRAARSVLVCLFSRPRRRGAMQEVRGHNDDYERYNILIPA